VKDSKLFLFLLAAFGLCHVTSAYSTEINIPEIPLFVEGSKTPLLQLVVQRDNSLFYEAYPSYEDINNDGVLDTTYKPLEIDYYGYFDSFLCYQTVIDHLEPVSHTSNKKCTIGWSGDFLNFATMTRMDLLRRSLYGGQRVVDTASETRLRRAFVPRDNHTWGFEYESEVINGFKISDYTPLFEPLNGHRHLFATNNVYLTPEPYFRVRRNSTERIWQWVDKEKTQGDGIATDEINLDVTVCKTGFLEDFCKRYPDGNYKPIGLLHEYGENNSMYFGLLTGSFNNNLQGGVLRQRFESFGDQEINPSNGTYTDSNGIVENLDSLQIPNDFSLFNVYRDCHARPLRAFKNGECRAWGNPIAEMMFEGMRYISGAMQPTPEFLTSGGVDEDLGLTPAPWNDPYSDNQPYAQCSRAYQLVISDPSPSFDGDQLPGSDFSSFNSTNLGDMHVGNLADFVSSHETDIPGQKFIGEAGAINDQAPSAKLVTSFRDIRGHAPEAPHRQGSYYASSVAYFGHRNDLHPDAPGEQTVSNFTLALGTPIPSIDIDVAGGKMVFAPFSRTVRACLVPEGLEINPFKPTNALVAFNIESLTDTSGSIRISFEDQEQGHDFDQDALVRYSYTVSGNQVTMTLDSIGSTTCFIQHMGYVVSGSTEDGVYLVVRNENSSPTDDPDYLLDVPPGEVPGGNWEDGEALPKTSTITFTADSNPAAEALHSPLWYAAKWGGFNDINEDGIPQRQEWDANLDGTPDNYFRATNPAEMLSTMRSVFQQISASSAAASSVAASSGSLRTASKIYTSEFKSGAWTGDVLSRTINTDGEVSPAPDWSAKEALRDQVATGSREILTYNPESQQGVPFRWPLNPANPAPDELSSPQISALSRNPVSLQMDALGELRIEFLRGEPQVAFREREDVLGDIIHASPVLVGRPSSFYPDYWGSGASENAKPYSSFVAQHRDRQRVVYAGANDGMLHAFDAGQWNGTEYSDGTGNELFAYVPSPAYPNLAEITSVNYVHKNFVDATPQTADVFIDGNWRTVLIGGLRGGGQGIYALDITEPGSVEENTADQHVLWEFTDEQQSGVGFTYSSPVIARMANGKWAAIMSGGYNNSADQVGYQRGDGRASVIIVDIETGQMMRILHPATARCQGSQQNPNGAAQPTAVDLDNDFKIDTIYAGDLYGCVYAFDVSDSSPSSWQDGELKHEAVDESGNPAPITAPIVVGTHPTGQGVMLYFGTGKYLEPSDQNPAQAKRRFYAIWDKGWGTNTDSRSTISSGNMLEQSITGVETRGVDTNGDNTVDEYVNVRMTSQESIDWDTHEGWYINLEFGDYVGEQVIAAPLLRDGKIFLSTHIPTGNECKPNQDGWFMIFDARSGAMLSDSQFDLNQDGNRNDGTIAGVSGLVNPLTSPTILAAKNGDVLLSQTAQEPQITASSLHSNFREGRLTWRELEP